MDGRRRIMLERELPPISEGRSWEIRSKVLGVYDKGAGKPTIMEREHVLIDRDTKEIYSRAWETAIFLGTGGWGGNRGNGPDKTERGITRCSWVNRAANCSLQSSRESITRCCCGTSDHAGNSSSLSVQSA